MSKHSKRPLGIAISSERERYCHGDYRAFCSVCLEFVCREFSANYVGIIFTVDKSEAIVLTSSRVESK